MPNPARPASSMASVGPRDVRVMAAVAAGGALGGVIRSAMTQWQPPPPGGWPWVTFVANVVGAAVLAWVLTARAPRRMRLARPLLGTGLCGALTTFSTMQVELVTLARDGGALLAAGYLIASLTAALAAIALVARAVRGR